MQIQQVPFQYVHAAWPKVERFIASALEYSQGECNIDQARVRVSDGRWVLYVAVNEENEVKGAACVEFNNMPNDRVALVVAIGGRLMTNQDTWQQFVGLLKANGATEVQGAARESIARLWTRYGFKEKYRVVGVKL